MANSLLPFSLFLFLSFSSTTTTSTTTKTNCDHPTIPKQATRPEIVQACKATRFQDTCVSSLSGSNSVPKNPTPLQLIQSTISVSKTNLKTAQSKVQSILDTSKDNANRTRAAKTCVEMLENSEYRITRATKDLLGSLKNARAWISAALTFQNVCSGQLKYVNDTSLTDQTMSLLNATATLTSNALSMIVAYDVSGNDTKSWGPPRTERDGFWGVSGTGEEVGVRYRGGFPPNLTVDVTVSKDGDNGCYKTVQEAVDTAPDNEMKRRYVIHIKEGVYEEIVRVPLKKKNVVFIGDGMGKTVITGSRNAGQPGVSTYNSAIVGVVGDGFMATNLTIQNTAPSHQAVAFRSDSDMSVLENCEFLGNQDTLYTHSLRQFFKNCRITGNVDYIFGNAAVVFEDCQILMNPRQENPEKGESNTITAHSRTDPGQSTGFVFRFCIVNGTEEYMKLYRSNPSVHKNFLGRPWREYARTVFIECNFEAIVSPQGWSPWSNDDALKTLYYGEFKNSGPGSNTTKRVPWSSQIPPNHVVTYSSENFLQGNEWIPTYC